MVFGPRAARSVADDPPQISHRTGVERRAAARSARRLAGIGQLPADLVLRIRTVLWNLVGVVRSEEGLTAAIEQLDAIAEQLPTSTPLESSSLLLASQMIGRSALFRRETVGSHYRIDAPEPSDTELRHSLVSLAPDDRRRIIVSFEADPAMPSSPAGPAPEPAGGRSRAAVGPS